MAEPPTAIPDVRVVLGVGAGQSIDGQRWLWHPRNCPFCGLWQSHIYDGGRIDENPRDYLGTRAAHCYPKGQATYRLVDDPAVTARIIEDTQQRWSRETSRRPWYQVPSG